MRAVWKKDKIISLKLSENVYSLAQMANHSALMQFFNIFNDKDEWDNLDLNKVDCLFLVPVGNVVIQHLGVRKIPEKKVVAKSGNFNHFLIKPQINFEGVRERGEFMWRGGDLIDLGPDLKVDPYYAPIVVPDLTVKEHRDLICKHEFENMYGDKNVQKRLLRVHREGVNEDHMKKKVFPEL